MAALSDSELIINQDGSAYHLHLKPGDLATKIITVGDPDRVDKVAKYLDRILLTRQAREFKTITGELGSTTISIMSTGIGTDNIDIVMNEVDALFNIDFESRKVKDKLTALKFMRLGTSGSIQRDVPVDSLVISKMATGLEGLMHYYKSEESDQESQMSTLANSLFSDNKLAISTSGSEALIKIFKDHFIPVNTVTATGFYAPQGRSLRLKLAIEDLIPKLSSLSSNSEKFHNLEMETAGIYGLATLLNHEAISISAILANRIDGTFSTQANLTVDKMIKVALELWESC